MALNDVIIFIRLATGLRKTASQCDAPYLRDDVDAGRVDDGRGEADGASARGPPDAEAVALVAQMSGWSKNIE